MIYSERRETVGRSGAHGGRGRTPGGRHAPAGVPAPAQPRRHTLAAPPLQPSPT